MLNCIVGLHEYNDSIDEQWMKGDYIKSPHKSNEDCTSNELYTKAIPLSAQLVIWYWEYQERKTKWGCNDQATKQAANYIKRLRNKLRNINLEYENRMKFDIEKLSQLLRDTKDWNK